jgi:transcriptional regulator with XRE-family HTH domain
MTRRDEHGGKDSAQLIEGLAATLRASKIRRVEIERKLEWSAGYVSRLLKGTIEMRLSHLFAILRAIEVPPSEFFRYVFPVGTGFAPRDRRTGAPTAPVDLERRLVARGNELDERIREVVVETFRDMLEGIGPEAAEDAQRAAEREVERRRPPAASRP